MRRWNGWGDEAITYHLPESAAQYLAQLIGAGASTPDASFTQVCAMVPPSRLARHTLIATEATERVRHARGQSMSDWIALRAGRVGVFPDGVAYAQSDDDARAILAYARETGARVIPYGGGTSVVGHINPLRDDAPIVTLDLSRMQRLLALDEASQLATFQAGVAGPELESQLCARGFTLGHYPQSWEYSTLGGWIATRSSGQQAYHYGRIENLFAGGHIETPIGALDLPPFPASAAGPDLREVILGSEGRMGVITRAGVRVRALPQFEAFYAVFFRDWEAGVAAVREMAQARVGVSMLRMSDALETETTLRLAGKDNLIEWAKRGLSAARYGSDRALLIFGVTGTRHRCWSARADVEQIARAQGGLSVPFVIGAMWRQTRFRTPYWRNTLWERGYAVDTLETAVPWSRVLPTADTIRAVLRDGLAQLGERVLAFAHLSHVYNDGASIYVTFLFRRAQDSAETLRRWQTLKDAASRAIVAQGGTISHQHGVGVDHAPYLGAEKGAVGMKMLDAVCRALDPEGVMNPGKLVGGQSAIDRQPQIATNSP